MGLQLTSRGRMQIPPSPGGAATHGPRCVGLQSPVCSCPRPSTEQIPTCPQLSPARCQEQKRFLMGLTRTSLVAGDRARLLQGSGRSILGSAPAGGQQGRDRFPIAAFSPACSQSGSSPHGPAPWSSPLCTGTAPAGWGQAGEGGPQVQGSSSRAPNPRGAAARSKAFLEAPEKSFVWRTEALQQKQPGAACSINTQARQDTPQSLPAAEAPQRGGEPPRGPCPPCCCQHPPGAPPRPVPVLGPSPAPPSPGTELDQRARGCVWDGHGCGAQRQGSALPRANPERAPRPALPSGLHSWATQPSSALRPLLLAPESLAQSLPGHPRTCKHSSRPPGRREEVSLKDKAPLKDPKYRGAE